MTFTKDSVAKILAGRKCGTTRLPSRQWQRVVRQLEEGRRVDAHIYNGNPRNRGELLYRAPFLRGVLCKGVAFDGEMILKDGFDDKGDLAQRLWSHYGKGKASRQSALEWMEASTWTWFEWGEPPAVEVRQDQLVEQPIFA